LKVCESVNKVNEAQKKIIFEKVKKRFGELKDKKMALWGLSFKPQTDDIRESPSITTINLLTSEGVRLKVFDPKAMNNAKEIFKDKIKYCKKPFDCLENSEALIVLTEWNEFRNPDFKTIGELMSKKIIFDGRNIYDPIKVKSEGFEYYGIGRG
jgi:UDPglucose 6-dehydrogenase